MPVVTVKTGTSGPAGDEEQISEYFCDSSNCPNVATRFVGCAKEIGLCIALCEEHAAKLGVLT
jgi:hypothetical protein